MKLRCSALLARLELGTQIGAFLPAQRDQPAAERLLLALIAQQAGGNIIVARKGAREARRIKRGLGDAGADMRPRHKSRIARERHPSEHRSR
jgi:hypothetical protein